MTARPVEDIVKALKEIVEKNGPNYLAEEQPRQRFCIF